MISSKCPICGGKLNIKIAAGLAECDSCGNTAPIDEAEAARFRAVYAAAERAMRKNTAEGYREAQRELEAIAFIDEAQELFAECEKRLSEMEADKQKRREFEKASEKSNTILGVVLAAVALLFCLAALAGIIYLIVRLANGSLPPWALWTTIGVTAAAVVLIIVNKLK